MKAWTKEEALKTLSELANKADQLRGSTAFSTEHVMWLTKCLDTFEEIFGPASRYYLSFAALTWRVNVPIAFNPRNMQAAIDAKEHEAYLQNLGAAKGLLLGAFDYLKDREISQVYDAKDTGPEASLILKVLQLAERQLRKVIRTRPEKESQVQDAFESLLVGADIPYGREVEKIEYSSKTYTPDFSLPKISLAIEVKLCNREGREKEIIDEINADILGYRSKYPNLLFIVYDLGFIQDVDRFSNSFQDKSVTIRVVKH